MSGYSRILIAAAAIFYLMGTAVPCVPSGALQATAPDTTTVDVFCPCHAWNATAASGVGIDWQGPRTAIASPVAARPGSDMPGYRAAWTQPPLDLRPPIPIV